MPATTLEEGTAPAKAAETPIPTGIRLVPFDEAFRNDPYPVLKRLRDAEPIHRDESLSRWFVTGFEDVREVLRNKDLSVNINNALPESYAGRLASNAKASGMSRLGVRGNTNADIDAMAKLLKSIENEGGGRLRGVGDVGPERESSLPRKA